MASTKALLLVREGEHHGFLLAHAERMRHSARTRNRVRLPMAMREYPLDAWDAPR